MSIFSARSRLNHLISELTPMAMKFSQLLNKKPFSSMLRPSNLQDFSNPFTSTSGLSVLSEPTYTAGTIAASGGVITVSNTGEQSTIVVQNTHVLTVPNASVRIRVSQLGSSATNDYLSPGLFYTTPGSATCSYAIFARWDRVSGSMQMISINNGTYTGIGSAVTIAMPTVPFDVIVNFSGQTSVTAYLDKLDGNGPSFMVAASSTAYSFISNGTQGYLGLQAGFLVHPKATNTWKISMFDCTRAGPTAMRDETVVTNLDGSPYIVSNNAYFTASCADPLGGAYCGVFKIDLTTLVTVQTGCIYDNRSSNATPDLTGHIVVVGDGTCHIFLSTFGSGTGYIQVVHAKVTGDLTAGYWVPTMTALSLPQPASAGAYDCMTWFDGSIWHMAYTITSDPNFGGSVHFYPALATSPDLATWTAIATDSAVSGSWEGVKIFKGQKNYYIMAGGPAGTATTSRVYDSSLNYLGALNIVFNGGTTTQPHPMLFASGSNAYVITFDNTQYGSSNFTWGDFIVYQSGRYVNAPAKTYATFNPSDIGTHTALSNGNLTESNTGGSANWSMARSTLSENSGKLYAEATFAVDPNAYSGQFGLATSAANLNAYLGSDAFGWGLQVSGGAGATAGLEHSGTALATGVANMPAGSVVSVAIDQAAGYMWFALNGTWILGGNPVAGTGPTYTFTPGTALFLAAASPFNATQVTMNVGATGFGYAPPAGFTGRWGV